MEDIATSGVYFTDQPGEYNTSHPILAKKALVRSLMDRAENICSDPAILAKEVEHLGKVLCYNNYPQWLIDKQGNQKKTDLSSTLTLDIR